MSVTLARSTIAAVERVEAAEYRAEHKDRTPEQPYFKDFRLGCVAPISDALGLDLWLDGVHLRGVVSGSTARQYVQAKLDREVISKLIFFGLVILFCLG